MSTLELYCAQPAWTGQTLSEFDYSTLLAHVLSPSRTKEKLCNGEIAPSGDQWPIFLYHGYNYDSEDPWNGLLRSALLVSVSPCCFERGVQLLY